MATTRSKELEPGFRKSKMAEIKGTRTRHVITFNPNKTMSGEEIYIDIPKLKPDTCLVPDSLNLQFDFKNANTKSWFLNNLSKLLCERLVIKFAGEVVYDNRGESVLSVYRDLWKSSSERDDMIEYGIAGENSSCTADYLHWITMILVTFHIINISLEDPLNHCNLFSSVNAKISKLLFLKNFISSSISYLFVEK